MASLLFLSGKGGSCLYAKAGLKFTFCVEFNVPRNWISLAFCALKISLFNC